MPCIDIYYLFKELLNFSGRSNCFFHVSARIVSAMADSRKLRGPRLGLAVQSWTAASLSFLALSLLPRAFSAGMSEITWWTHYSWHLLRQDSGPLAGCWTVEQMFPAAPPIETVSQDATPLVTQAND